ncbi:MFS transporter [Candidatus Bathyarchaeota archaeon]|nr:MFS transporter [Candidatus Bathyarchaeota archaeon]
MREETEPKNRSLTLPTLIASISSIDPPGLIISMSLIEVAAAFGVSVGLAGQIRSVGSVLAIIVALAMGVLSVRYSYKSLLLGGLLVNLISVLCCSFAPTFSLLLVCFSAVGLVTSLVTPMVFSYIGETFTEDRRPQVVGTVAAVRTISYLVMVQLIGYVVAAWGWRQAFMFLVAPMTAVALLLSQRVLPSIRSEATASGADVLEGYRGVFASRSALACLLGNMLAGGAWAGGVVAYSVTYLREGFVLSLSDSSRIFSLLVVGVLVGNYVGGLIARRLGGKRVMVVSSLLTGLLVVGYMNSPSLGLAIVLSAVMSVAAGVVLTCANTLLLVQVPRYRGTMTSLNSAATQLGMALGASLGGVILDVSSWGVMGLVYGGMHVAAALIYLVGVKDRE